MQEVEISVRVKGERAVVRKVVRDDRDRVIGEYGLSSTGRWLPVPEGEAYPRECVLSAGHVMAGGLVGPVMLP